MPVNLSAPVASHLQAVPGVRIGVAEAGVRKAGRKDLTVMLLDAGTSVGGVFTSNRFCAAPVQICRERLLNGGNEIEFHRCLAVGERCVANARYADVRLKQGKSGQMLLVTIETRFTTEGGALLAVNRQTLIWR